VREIHPRDSRRLDSPGRLLHPRPAAERARLIRLAHESKCQLGLSYRRTRERLAEHGGAAVSVGTVFNWLAQYECDHCGGTS
jgi:hypothetical protein